MKSTNQNSIRRSVALLCVICVWGLLFAFPIEATTNERAASKTIVYYFHTTGRCPTCLKMEKYTKEALNDYFSEELKSGKIEWKVLDVELPQNNHFIKDYGLFTKSVILSELKSGKEVRWKNLDQIWMKVRDKNAYLAYIKQELEAFRKGVK